MCCSMVRKHVHTLCSVLFEKCGSAENFVGTTTLRMDVYWSLTLHQYFCLVPKVTKSYYTILICGESLYLMFQFSVTLFKNEAED